MGHGGLGCSWFWLVWLGGVLVVHVRWCLGNAQGPAGPCFVLVRRSCGPQGNTVPAASCAAAPPQPSRQPPTQHPSTPHPFNSAACPTNDLRFPCSPSPAPLLPFQFGAFWTNGQICSATSRLLVHEDVAPAFLQHLKKRAEAINVRGAWAGGQQYTKQYTGLGGGTPSICAGHGG